MLDEAMVALAASVGSGVVQAAGSDAWMAFRGRLARLFGRGDGPEESAQLRRLDRTAAELAAAARDEDEARSARREELQGAGWQARTEDLLDRLEPEERAAVAVELHALLAEVAEAVRPAAGGASGNVILGSAAIQYGDGNVQMNRFDARP
ncbi:hypothetical protein ACWGDE_12120 [Streptomyces sp. NPDC054956]